MMKKFFALAVLIVVAALIGLVWLKSSASQDAASATAKANAGSNNVKVASGALPPSAVLKIDPSLSVKSAGTTAGAGGAAASTRRGQLPPVTSPLMSEYLARKDFPALMAKVSQLPNDGEALFLRAQLLERCAKKTDAPADAKPRPTPEERRAAFVASLLPNHADTQQRISAYDAANPDSCGTLRSLETTGKDIADLLARAKELKDPSALARDLNCEIFESADRTATSGSRAPEITDSRVERIRQAIASRNPVAVRVGVGMLANTYRNGAFRIGADGANVDTQAMFHAANMISCQYGSDCNVDVLRACASEGKCRANNYDDYLAYYELSPNAAQTVESYRAQLTQMIDSGDFSSLQLVKGEQPAGSVRTGSYFPCKS
jgi:hypothetical protein